MDALRNATAVVAADDNRIAEEAGFIAKNEDGSYRPAKEKRAARLLPLFWNGHSINRT
jgi:hypothetical protein